MSDVYSVVELQPCPFCGGGASLEYRYTDSRHHSDYKDNYTIICDTGNCFGRTSIWKAYHKKNDAISAWNTRNGAEIITIKTS
jgi:Lar family restriction alleviation protein